ncbi:MAG: thioesterase [Bacteroidetes bacterium]|nr:MAG: thioesterase [Bacteroidota bacterium]
MNNFLQSFWKNNGKEKLFCIHHRVKYADTDRMDMVYHGSYIHMLESARVETLREIGWVYSKMEEAGILLPVIDLKIKYKKPGRYDQILRIETHVLKPPTSRIDFHFKIMHEEDLLVEAQVTLAFIDSNGKPRRAPDGLARDLEKNALIHS